MNILSTSIYVSKDSHLNLLLDGYQNRSQRIEDIAKRYSQIFLNEAPQLSLRAWQTLWALFREWDDDDMDLMWAKVVSAEAEPLQVAESFLVNLGDFIQRKTSLAARYAILEVIQVLPADRTPTRQELIFAGAKFPDTSSR